MDRGDWIAASRYQIIRRIGAGGMGIVYEAYDHGRRKRVALKRLLNFSADGLYRFKQEFRTLHDIAHPNLVRLHELVVNERDDAFFAMELIEGVDFCSFVRAAGPAAVVPKDASNVLTTPAGNTGRSAHSAKRRSDAPIPEASAPVATVDFERARHAANQLALGVHALHAAGKLHRDLKPSNVLVAHDQRVVVLDFGVATSLRRRRDFDPDEVVGTLPYMAPEQASGEPLQPASDWYSLGVMLYEALVGRRPFGGPPADMLAAKTLLRVAPPSEYVEGVPPDLNDLCVALLDPDPDRRPKGDDIVRHTDARRNTGRPMVRSAHAAAPGRLVGRDTQLRALRDALADVASGRCAMVRVTGPSGAGKSALVEHFLEELAQRGKAVVLSGRAYERESMPYKAFDSLVDTLSQHLMELDELPTISADLAALACVFPVLRRIPAIAELTLQPSQSPHQLRRRAFAALRELLATIARTRPVVLHIDDAQWGDADSAALLLELLRPPDEPALLTILSYREAEADVSPFLVETWLHWANRTGVRDVTVGPLQPEEARSLVLGLLADDSEASRATAEAIIQEAQGSPFLLEEITRSAGERRSPIASPYVPSTPDATLGAVMAQRLASLPDEPRRAIEAIAVAGYPLPIRLLAEACALDDRAIDVVALLRERRFVRAGVRGGNEVVEVIHNRVGEAIVAALPDGVVRERHNQFARALESPAGADAEALATHLVGAGDTRGAGAHAERAAQQAASKLAFDRAARLFRLALQARGEAPAQELRELRTRLGEALEAAGRSSEAARAYAEAATGASGIQRTELERAAAENLLAAGQLVEGEEQLRKALLGLGIKAPTSSLSALFWLVVYYMWLLVRGLRPRRRPVQEVPRLARARIDGLFAASLGFSVFDPIVGQCMVARHLVEALRRGDEFQLLRATILQSTNHAAEGGPEGRTERALVRLATELAERDGSPHALAFVRTFVGVSQYLRGRFKEAKDILDGAPSKLPIHRAAWQSNANVFAMWSRVFLGDFREMRLQATRLLAEAESRGDIYTSIQLRDGTLNQLWLAEDDPEGGRSQIREVLGAWPHRGYLLQDWHAAIGEVEFDLYEGKGARAYARLARDRPQLRRSLLLHCQFIRIVTNYARGRCAVFAACASTSRRRALLREAERAVRSLAGEGMPYASMYGAVVEASVASAKGDGARAQEALQRVARLADALEMAGVAAVARFRLGELLGGAEGERARLGAEQVLLAKGVVAPIRYVRSYLPDVR